MFIWPSAVRAQGTGVIAGVVLDETGQPVADVELSIVGALARARSDSAGGFRLSGTPSGQRVLSARRIGYLPTDTTLRVPAEGTLRVKILLVRRPTQLDTVTITDACPPTSILGFFCRRRSGNGTFLESDSIAAVDAGYVGMGDLFRERPGFRMEVSKGGVRYPVATDGWQCLVTLVNGRPPRFSMPIRYLKEVEAVEIYTHARDVPKQYKRWSDRCSLVVYWSKRTPPRSEKAAQVSKSPV